MKDYARATRVKYGRKAVEPGLSDALTSQKEKLRPFYTYELMESTKVQQKTKAEVSKHQPHIFCKDIGALWALIIELRKIAKDDEEITIGIDDGQDMLKIMCTIKKKSKKKSAAKRAKYSDGINPHSANLAGVKKTFILALMPYTCENYINLKRIMSKLNFRGLKFTFTLDMKMCLLLLGKQMGACKFACILCDGCSPWLGEFSMLTLKSLMEWFQEWDKSDHSDGKPFRNVIHESILSYMEVWGEDTLIMDILNIPELHILLGKLI